MRRSLAGCDSVVTCKLMLAGRGSKVILSLFVPRLFLVRLYSHLTFMVLMGVDGRGVEMPEVVRDSAPTVNVVDGTGPRGPSS